MDKIKALEEYLYKAIDLFYKNDAQSLYDKSGELSALERSYVFRVAYYLQSMLDTDKRFKEVVVDCEYGNATSNTGECLTKYMTREGVRPDKKAQNKDCVFPDLIVHKRHTHKKNLLVAEFKGYWNTSDWEKDGRKLKLFTKKAPVNNLEQFFSYCAGVFVVFGKKQRYTIIYRNGEQETKNISIKFLKQQKETL